MAAGRREAEAEAGKTVTKVGALANQAASTISGSLATAIVQGDSLNETFKNIIETLAQMIIKALIFRAIMLAIGGGGGGL